ncbi:MAG TPA: UDP-N-acetylmuramate--L-alanine ligase [Candidatus Bipolaricaulota bacterium]|nr:UDP-N-acetylmuramate--L-alanine ligase [Candidatus Bipolaricaulota bacterium]
MEIDLNKIKKVYLTGIGGIGVSALARYFLNLKKEVVGSDLVSSEITAELETRGVSINYDQKVENISAGIDLLIHSAAVKQDNPERQKAIELNIPQMGYNEFLGLLSLRYKTIAVSGTNGKTTTTAMLSGALLAGGLDPTVILGSLSPALDGNFRAGQSDFLVVEACEYRSHFLTLNPFAIVLTNIEEDHLDYFRDINHILSVFQQYINKLKNKDDILVINKDDENQKKLAMPECQVISYGFSEDADVVAKDCRIEGGKQVFRVEFNGNDLGDFELKVPGRFNISNALAVIALCLKLNLSIMKIKEALAGFSGTWRRLEIVGRDPLVISDYAHHPTAVEVTRQAVEDFYPGKNKIIVFQPHQHNRTKKLFDDFVASLLPKDRNETIIINEIFDVTGRDESDNDISSEDLVEAVNKRKISEFKDVLYSGDLETTLKLIKQNIDDDSVVLIMGAGDIYKIAGRIAHNT